MSRYEETLRAIALEPDEDRRLEMAAEIDREAADLDENWANRDGYAEVEAERDRIAAERDEAIIARDDLQRRYAERFFDAGEGITDRNEIVDAHAEDVRKESSARGFAALWEDR